MVQFIPTVEAYFYSLYPRSSVTIIKHNALPVLDESLFKILFCMQVCGTNGPIPLTLIYRALGYHTSGILHVRFFVSLNLGQTTG